MKKTLCILLTLMLLLSCAPLSPVSFAASVVDSGTCGDNLTWTLDDEGTLTISGTGKMKDYSRVETNHAPWYQNAAVQNVVIKNGVTSIGNSAFYSCGSIESITIPDGVTSIGNSAFQGCSALTGVTIPDSVTSVKSAAFMQCSSLTSITIPDGVTTVSIQLFDQCSSLKQVTLPDSVTTINNSAFHACSSLESIIIPDGVTIIAGSAFSECSALKSITIPDGVTSIGPSAFSYCSSLESVTVPGSVTYIGESAFYRCFNLTNVVIPGSVTDIGSSAFSGCHILCYKNTYAQTYAEENHVPYGLLDGTEEENTFSGSVGRLNWTIDRLNRVLTIDCAGAMPAFSRTTTDGNGTDAPWYALKNYVCTVVLLDGVTSISDYAFCKCDVITQVVVPDSVTSIGAYAFDSCSSLTGVTMPDNVTSIGDHAFMECSSLSSVVIPGNVTSISRNTFNDCSSLTSVTIGDGVTSIREFAFSGCSSLPSVTIPNSVTRIDQYAFNRCVSLTSVVIPVGVAKVQNNVFSACTALESVYFYNPSCTIIAGATPANATVYGYSGSTAETYADENGLRFMEIDGHEHHFTVTRTVDATCTEDGYRTLSCPCGEQQQETIPATGHTETVLSAVAATCTEPGLTEGKQCAVCGEILLAQETIPANGHTALTVGTSDPTCGKAGFTGVTYCTVCKVVLDSGESIPATGAHTPGEAVTENEVAATCTQGGSYEQVVFCTKCDEEISRTVVTTPATGHLHTSETAAADPTRTAHGYTAGTYCEDCETWLSGHEVIHNQYGEREVVKEATETEEGEVIITCTVCGGRGLYALEKLPHTEPNPDDTNDDDTGGGIGGAIRRAARSIINFLLRLIRWLGGKR